jgi:Tol biopolymer transport system component
VTIVLLSHPAWSPDEKKLAVVLLDPDFENGVFDFSIEIIDMFSGARTTVFQIETEVGGLIGQMAWSPNQDKLAFIMKIESTLKNNGQLHILDITSGELRQLTEEWMVATPNFSPDGSKILFVGSPEALTVSLRYDLFVSDINGNCHRIKSPVPRLERISLSQDGEFIALDTYHGVLVAETKTALGDDFWTNGDSCNPSVEESS